MGQSSGTAGGEEGGSPKLSLPAQEEEDSGDHFLIFQDESLPERV